MRYELKIFDRRQVRLVSVSWGWVLGVVALVGLLSYESDEIWNEKDGVYAVRTEVDTFSVSKLSEYLDELNMPFKRVVMAQAIQESGHFKSVLFKEHNNLFGMKRANVRPTTSIGIADGHAAYNSWRESVIDYALWYARYASACRTEEEYLKYLGTIYAEDKEYVNKLKRIIGTKWDHK